MAGLDGYLDELRARIEAEIDVAGIYVGGSYALGVYEPGRSDLDVAAVSTGDLSTDEKLALVEATRHESLPCPARGLELVVYSAEAAASRETSPDFELNLNTGARMDFRVDLVPDPREGHWFAIDRAILREHGVVLAGPPASEVFGKIHRPALLGVVSNSLHWHVAGPARTDDAILNACRALRFALEDVWSSKPAAGRWALTHADEPALVAAALLARTGGPPPAAADARAFVSRALARVAAAEQEAASRVGY